MKYRGQSTLILILIVIMIFLGLGIFLLSFAGSIQKEEYMNTYTNNLLLSLLRTDTGYQDASCKQISDLIGCSFSNPNWHCGEAGSGCKEIGENLVDHYINKFDDVKNKYNYLLVARVEGRTDTFVVGNESVLENRGDRLTANEVLLKDIRGRQYYIKITLILEKK